MIREVILKIHWTRQALLLLLSILISEGLCRALGVGSMLADEPNIWAAVYLGIYIGSVMGSTLP